ncbi:MAG: sulfotransferase [Candidatus Limnocylindrales bacterium]
MGRTPDFFLVGAPKCGTSAMHMYLRAHPSIFMPERKEPHHFGADIRSPRFVNERRDYLALFDAARHEAAIGEASVWYLASTKAAEEIAEFRPDARILMMLRSPIEMVRSLHNHNIALGVEDITDLAVALDAGTARFEGRTVGLPAITRFLDYLFVGHFADQIARFQAVFPSDQIHIVIYEEFARAPERVYEGVLRFLGVDPTFRPTFERINPSRRSRSATLARWLHAPPIGAQRAVRRVVPAAVRRRLWQHGIKSALTRANTEPALAPPLSGAVRERLRAEYALDVRRTAELIGRPDLPGLWGYEDDGTPA